jgi:hypothetical protein
MKKEIIKLIGALVIGTSVACISLFVFENHEMFNPIELIINIILCLIWFWAVDNITITITRG